VLVNTFRNVILGRHSKVWLRLQQYAGLSNWVALGHSELAGFAFTVHDRVWVLSYSRYAPDNAKLLAHLQQARVHEVVYVTSSSTVVCGLTRCYEYPRVKHMAEQQARALPHGRVLTIGLMHDELAELPGGQNVTTTFDELAAFMQAPQWRYDSQQGHHQHLLRVVSRPHRNAMERAAYRGYGALLRAAGSKPCLLRPLDLGLRMLGARWYGYVYLSNQLWISMIS
jgi:hypothetical protein